MQAAIWQKCKDAAGEWHSVGCCNQTKPTPTGRTSTFINAEYDILGLGSATMKIKELNVRSVKTGWHQPVVPPVMIRGFPAPPQQAAAAAAADHEPPLPEPAQLPLVQPPVQEQPTHPTPTPTSTLDQQEPQPAPRPPAPAAPPAAPRGPRGIEARDGTIWFETNGWV